MNMIRLRLPNKWATNCKTLSFNTKEKWQTSPNALEKVVP
jgi:hypothetical protein